MTLARLPQAVEEHPHASAKASRISGEEDEEPQTGTAPPLQTTQTLVSQRRKKQYSNTLLRRLGLVYTKTEREAIGPLETTCK